MNHFMLDLETMSLDPNAAIVSIGVVEFDERDIGRQFYVNVDLQDGLSLGLVQSQSTADWWAQQDESARAAWQKDPVPVVDALTQLNRYLEQATGGLGQVRIWGNGSDFDNVVLRSSYKAVGADEPWKYYHNRCYRTMMAQHPLDPDEQPARVGTYHNALDDALTQTLRLQMVCQKYRIQLA